MSFLVDLVRTSRATPDETVARWKAYLEYIESIGERLAPGAWAYATSESHRNNASGMSPHDGWVESVMIEEPATGERREVRSIKLTIEILGPCHDGRIRFTYSGVRAYGISAPAEFEGPPLHSGHGDWLVDEIGLSERGLVLHEILFSRGARWQIEAEDLQYEWLPFVT